MGGFIQTSRIEPPSRATFWGHTAKNQITSYSIHLLDTSKGIKPGPHQYYQCMTLRLKCLSELGNQMLFQLQQWVQFNFGWLNMVLDRRCENWQVLTSNLCPGLVCDRWQSWLLRATGSFSLLNMCGEEASRCQQSGPTQIRPVTAVIRCTGVNTDWHVPLTQGRV